MKKFKRSQKRKAAALKRLELIGEPFVEQHTCHEVTSPDVNNRSYACAVFLQDLRKEAELLAKRMGPHRKSCLVNNSVQTGTVLDESKEKKGEEGEGSPKAHADAPTVQEADAEITDKEKELENLLKQIDLEVLEYVEPPSPAYIGKPEDKRWEDEPDLKPKPAPTVAATPIEACKFFRIVGACRYGESCQKRHEPVTASRTILMPQMFTSFGRDLTERARRTGGAHGDVTDVGLEYTDADVLEDYREFVGDVVPELKRYGELTQFKVCLNGDAHLRGSVYVQYGSLAEAGRAFGELNGRWFNGKRLYCRYVKVQSWRDLICGVHWRGDRACPHGAHCNYLHVFSGVAAASPGGTQETYRGDDDMVMFSHRYRSFGGVRYGGGRGRACRADLLKDEDSKRRSRSHRKRRRSSSKDRVTICGSSKDTPRRSPSRDHRGPPLRRSCRSPLKEDNSAHRSRSGNSQRSLSTEKDMRLRLLHRRRMLSSRSRSAESENKKRKKKKTSSSSLSKKKRSKKKKSKKSFKDKTQGSE